MTRGAPAATVAAVLTLGHHLLVEYAGCPGALLDDVDGIAAAMMDAARAAGATIVASDFHRFSPLGVSGVVVIQESHLTIHTWPEHGYAAVDLFTCGDSVDAGVAYEILRQRLGATSSERRALKRGPPRAR